MFTEANFHLICKSKLSLVKNLYLLAAFAAIVSLHSCKLDPNWDVDALAPIAQTTLTPANLIPEGNVTADTSGKLHYLYENTVYTVPLDSLFKIPDTTYTYSFISPATFTVQPGFPASIFDGYLSPKINTASLTELVVLSGGIEIKATSYAPQPLNLEFNIPKAKKNGQSFSLLQNLEAAPAGGSVVFTQFIDLAGYNLDLTGDNGLLGNRLRMKILATVASQAQAFPITAGTHLVDCEIKLSNLKPYYAKGSVNTQQLNISADTVKLGVLDMVKSGSVNLEDISMKLTVENGIGVDLQALIYQISGLNNNGNQVNLTHPSINNSININRAQANLYQTPEYTPSLKEITFNTGNSNLKSFIENLPSKIGIDAKFIVNPFGNVSGGNDFIFHNSKTSLKVKVEAPLAFAINDLVLVDTVGLNINVGENQPVKSATIRAHVNNGFPLGANMQVYFPGINGNGVDSLFFSQDILPGIVGNDLKVTSPTYSILQASAEGEKLERLLASDKIWFKIKLATTPNSTIVSMYDGYKMDVQLTAQIKYGL